MSNCTKSVYSISFAVHEITLNHSGVLSFSFSRHVQYSWWQCSPFDSRNEVWFKTELVWAYWSNPGRGGHSLIWPSQVCVICWTQYSGFQFHDLESYRGCLFGLEVLNEKSVKYGNEQSKWGITTISFFWKIIFHGPSLKKYLILSAKRNESGSWN